LTPDNKKPARASYQSALSGPADDVNLQLGAVDSLNPGPNDGVINLTAIQIDADFFADLVFALLVPWAAR
jgi:hypothetical protein